ncbi:MAG TPA: hypothetical protein PKY05_01295 [Fibrobacteria bacterium]|nr:hypothetical protein [Fibrobacteria bacterium]
MLPNSRRLPKVAFLSLAICLRGHSASPDSDTLALKPPSNPSTSRIALGGQWEMVGSGDAHLWGLHVASLDDRTPDQRGWGLSIRFGVGSGMLERDTSNHYNEIAPSDATPTGSRRLRALEVSGGVTQCLASPFWLELGGGYYLPERTAEHRSASGKIRWYADGANSAVPMAMGALLADFSSWRVPVYLRLGASRADNTTFWSAGLGWAATLPN